MEDKFYDNDFERFLQQQVKHHRMYPSDAVWKGIYKQVHGHKKWPGLYFFAILTVASLIICTLFIESETIIYPQQPTVAKATTLQYNQLNPDEITEHTIRNIKADNDNAFVQPSLTLQGNDLPAGQDNPVTVSRPVAIAVAYDDLATENNSINTDLINTSASVQEDITTDQIAVNPNTTNTSLPAAKAKKKRTIAISGGNETETGKRNINPTDEYLEQHPEEADRIAQQKIRTRPAKWELQFYIAPSMNYRNIVDEKGTEQSGGPVANNYGVDASKVIRYHPGMGIEFGIGALYNVNNKLKIKAALQYNIRQYNIEAYAGTTELAKIALFRGSNVDTLRAISRFRSSGAYGEAQLQNKYHQVSLPVGVEYTLFASKRFGLNVGGTLQPTYTFSQSSYLLSSDYKSYADGKSILRRWNLNSSLEAVFTYNARNVQWRFGPQLRYQHLPNYTDAYSIKEYLIDYGFKIGFTKAIR
jgi:hypothetical protein